MARRSDVIAASKSPCAACAWPSSDVQLRNVRILRQHARKHPFGFIGAVAPHERETVGVLERRIGMELRIVAKKVHRQRIVVSVQRREREHTSDIGALRLSSRACLSAGMALS